MTEDILLSVITNMINSHLIHPVLSYVIHLVHTTDKCSCLFGHQTT